MQKYTGLLKPQDHLSVQAFKFRSKRRRKIKNGQANALAIPHLHAEQQNVRSMGLSLTKNFSTDLSLYIRNEPFYLFSIAIPIFDLVVGDICSQFLFQITRDSLPHWL